MNNPEKNDVVIIELDRPRELRLGHKALKRFSAMTGRSMTDFDSAMGRYDELTCLVYAMLSVSDPVLTPEDVDDLLDMVPIAYVIKCASEAVEAAFADEDNTDERSDDPTKAAGTGEKA